jgi:hypothetical protein
MTSRQANKLSTFFFSATLLCFTLVAILFSPTPVQALQLNGVYVGACDNATLSDYENWAGTMDVIVDFPSRDSWDKMANEGIYSGWGLGGTNWDESRKSKVVISLAMVPENLKSSRESEIRAGANGQRNFYFQSIAQSLKNNGYGNATIRLGWEFNGDWYAHSSNDNTPQEWIGYFRQIVDTMRSVPGTNFRINWNPNHMQNWHRPAAQFYPGDNYVDEIGLDVYDACWESDTYPIPAGASEIEKQRRRRNAWIAIKTKYRVSTEAGYPSGLDGWVRFASEHGKPLTIPEWGVNERLDASGDFENSGEDNPYYIEQMYNWMKLNNVTWHGYFENFYEDGNEGDRRLNPIDGTTKHPLARAKFKELFIDGSGTNNGVESVMLDMATSIPPSGSTSILVDYNANQTRDFIVDVFDSGWRWMGQSRVNGVSGSGSRLVTVDYPSSFLNVSKINTSTANIKVSLLPSGGSWNEAIQEDYQFDVPVESSTPADFEVKLWNADGLFRANAISNWGVASFDPGDWIRFDNVDLKSGYNDFAISYGTTLSGQIEVRLDSPTGTLLGIVNYSSSGDWSTQAWDGTPLTSSANGTHSVFLVMKSGTANVYSAWFKNN